MSKENIIIATLSTLVLALATTIVVIINQEAEEKIVHKTIVEEKIVYITEEKETVKAPKKKEVKEIKKELSTEAIKYDLPEVEVPVTKDKQYILSQTRDNKGRFSIALVTPSKPPKKAFYDRKIILKSEIEDGEYLGEFLFLVPPSAVENIADLSIKITDAVSGDSFTQVAYCLDGIEDAFTYSMNISFSDGFSCYTQEIAEALKIPKPSKESVQKMQEIFAKLKNNSKSKE